MRIRSFHIDGFGVFSDVAVEALSPGLSIFLGRNEAGKSTCLDFFRAILTGYPDPRSKEARERSFAPLHGGQAGGSLDIETRRHGIVRLTRRPGNGGGPVTLLDAEGKPLDLGVLDQLMAGVTREVYRNVFGFSLAELQTFDSLNSEGVRHALYGASFGMGLRGPGQVFKMLDDQMDALFKSGGSKPPLNAALREWETLRQAVRAAEEECAQFDALSLELRGEETALAALRARREDMQRQRRELERRLGVWRQWDEWRAAGARLERLEPVADTFPQDGPNRLARARDVREEAARRLTLSQERLERTQQALDAIEIREDLLCALPEIRALSERKSGFRSALTAQPAQTAALQRAKADLERQLTSLGPDWSCERIRDTDRSLFAREGLERQAAEMNVASSAYTAAADALEKANKQVENAEHAQEVARTALEYLPDPVAALDEEGRDALRRILACIEEDRRRLPERRQALQAAHATFNRTYAPLRLRSGGDPAQTLEKLADAQEKALELAGEVQSSLTKAQEAALAATQAHDAEEAAKERLDRLKAQQQAGEGPTRTALDNRAAALRSLRHLSADLNVEQDRLTELDGRMATMQAPAPLKSAPLIGIGILLMLAGLAVLIAHWKLGISSFDLTPELSLPITLWSGYLVILTGVGFLAGGLPRSGPEAKRHALEAEHLGSRRDTSAARVVELQAQLAELAAAAQVDSVDPITLDATEMLLERERELCVTEERLSQELGTLEGELAAARERARRLQTARLQMETEVQQTRKRWHEFLGGCHVESIPAPEAAATFFARMESARVAHAAVIALEGEIAALETHIAEQERAARALPPVAELLTAEADLPAVLDAVRRVLDACREADAAAEERLKAKAALHNAELNVERAAMAQGEAMDALHAAEERRGAAQEAWSECLETLGLGLDLSPGTVREALECMERCLTAEAEVARMEDELARTDKELDALIQPLQTLSDNLNRPLPTDADGLPDWLGAVDALLRDAAAMEAAARERERLESVATEQYDEVRTAETALADAIRTEEELLGQAGAADAEEFLRHAAVKAEREELTRRREDLEDALRLAADDIPLEEFIHSFAEFDRNERETFAAQLVEELAALTDEEREKAARIATLSAGLATLTSADKLSVLRQREASLSESMRRMALEWSRRALARHMLAEAKRNFERERQPQVIRAASEILATITDNVWAGLAASLEDSSLTVLPPHGEPVAPEVLSRGTQEQIYLALRLAYIRNHAAHAAALPVIMDDILVNFDPVRAERTAVALRDLTAGGANSPAHQVLFFTCHPHIAEMLRRTLPGSALYAVENGRIQAA